MIETSALAAGTHSGGAAGAAGDGTAVRDTAAAGLLAVVLCAAATGTAEPTLAGVLGVLLGLGIAGAAGTSVVIRPGRWSGPADRVTLVRAAGIAGCATLSVLVAAQALPPRPWWLAGLLVPTLALDAVDGFVARRTRTASPAGGRLDGELDAALLLVVSLGAVRSLGWWVLAIGLMRYVFWLLGRVRARQRGSLPFSQFRRVVAGFQGAMFAIALTPVVPVPVGRGCVAVALALLVASFGSQILALERQSHQDDATPGS